MDQCLRDIYQRGLITYEDAMKKSVNPDELKKMIFGSADEEQQAQGRGGRR